MFNIKCINCKLFSPKDGCEKGLEEDSCNSFILSKEVEKLTDEPSCENCQWQTNGFCDFDYQSPKTCRRFKSLKEDN